MTMNENKETKTSITDRKTYPKRNRKCVYKKVTVNSVLTVNKSKTSNKTSVRLKLAKSKIFPKLFKDPKLCYTCTECEGKFKSKLNMAVHMKIHKLERNRLKATEDLKKELICQTSPLNTPLDQLDSNCQLEEISTRSINTVQYCENTIQNIFVYRHKKPFKHRKPNSLIDKQCDSNFEDSFTNDSGVIVIPNIYNCGRMTPFRTRKPNGLPPLIDDMLLLDKLNKHPLEIHLEKAKYTIKNSRTHSFSNTQSTVDSNFFKKHNLTVNSEIPIIASVVNNRGNDSIDFTLTKCRKKPTISDKDIYKPFECNHCGLSYKRRDYLRDHMITAHNGVFPYNCETCNKGFLRPNVLISHMRSHTGEKPFICHICNKHFAHKSNLHNHLKLHSGLKPFVCNECGKSFCTRANLSSHMKKHNGVKAHKCTKCERAFVHADTLKKHMMIHTGEKPFKCLICDKSFRRRTHLTVHERHHTNSRPFRCETCDKSFFEKSVLQSHMLQHTGVKAHTCNMCNKSFCHRSTLNVHQKIHGGERLFHCSVCEKSFCDKTTLVRHIRIHTGEKPFQCTVCNLRFRQSSNLKRHQRIHTGERPYKCTYCEKLFAQNINLTNHIRIHTGEKPFTCGTCNKAFTQRSNLISHQKSHAGEDQIVEIYAEYPKGGARQTNAQPIRFKIRGTNMSISLDDLVTTSDTDVQRKLQLISERIAKKTLQNQGKFYLQSPTCQQDESTIVEETTNEPSEVNLPAEENQEESQEENESIIEQQDKYVEAIQFDNRTFIVQLAEPPSSQEERAQLQESLKQHLEQFQQSTTGEGEEKSFVVSDVSKGDLAAARNIYLEPNQTLALAALNHENLIVESNHANEIVISAQDNINIVNQEDQVIIPLADQEHLSELSQENVNEKDLFNVETIKVDKESDIYIETSSSQVDFSAVVVENRITHQPNEVFALSTNHLPQDEQHNVIAIEINNPQQQPMQNKQVVGININQSEMQLATAEFSNAQENTFVVSSYDRAAYEQLLSTVVLQQQPASLDKSDTNFYTGITEETVIEENSQNESNSYYAGISEETVGEPQQQQNDNIQNILHYAVVSQTIESE